jgi:hypothetical protein
MKITSFIEGYETQKEIRTNIYKQSLDRLLKSHEIDFLDYNYLINFGTNSSVIISTNKFVDIINVISDSTKIKESITENHPRLLTIKNDKLAVNKDIYKDATNLKNIKLTKEQKRCVKKIIKFLMDSSKKVFGLYGFAGTGKTTTCVELINYLLINRYIPKVVLTAPTHKALNVIKSKFKPYLKIIYETLTNKKLEINSFDDILIKLNQINIVIDFITIHKLLGFKNNYNKDGDIIFIRDSTIKKSLVNNYDLVVIDECSMVSLNMLDVIFDTIRKTNKKILFSGDPAQLPPVNESQSFIFIKHESELDINEYIEHIDKYDNQYVTSDIVETMNYNRLKLVNDILNIDTFLLKDVVRSKISNVTDVCYEIRRWVKNQTDMPQLFKFTDKKGAYFYQYNSKNKNGKKKIKTIWFKKYIEYLEKDYHSIILTWTNKQSNIYNKKVREEIFNKKKLEKFIGGDILILTDFYSLETSDEKIDSKFYTSDQIRVVDTDKVIFPINSFQFNPNKVLRRSKGSITIEDKCKKFIRFINAHINNITFKCWALCVKKICDDSNKYNFIRVLDDSEKEKYKELKLTITSYISDFSNKMLYGYKEKEKFIEQNVIKLMWEQFHSTIVSPFAKVDYGYSITCHKSQGSNFYNVFVDVNDILKNKNQDEVKKCTYTAVTRTSNELFLLI